MKPAPTTSLTQIVRKFIVVLLVFALLPSGTWAKQEKEEAMTERAVRAAADAHTEEQDQKKQDEKSESQPEDSEVAPVTPPSVALESIEPNYIRFHLWDGLIVGGNMEIDAIDVETEFGSLKIPIRKIMRFHPGLESMPGLQTRINDLVEGLGDRNFEIREQSHNELLSLGLLLRNEIAQFEDGGSAERKKHLLELRKKIDELTDEDEESSESARPLIRGDFIQTPSFSVVGKIVQTEFRLKSQFGEMVIPLGEIKMGDRTFGLIAPETRKTVDIEVTAFFPDGMNTKIKVNRGDKVAISATGDMNWTNWNSSCGPDGMSDKGQFRSFKSGMLLAQVGSKGQLVKIGTNGSFVAKSNGDLYLGVAMADNFRAGGYNWTGKYTAKIVVKPQGIQ
jgi:hypothetical protein